MPRFRITETVTFEVEGDDAQDALDSWLNEGQQADGYTFCEVSEREITDAAGRPVEVREPY